MPATLSETLAQKKKKRGVLTRDSEGQLRERTDAGTRPLTPVGAKLQGIDSPDVAKMVGDARQKRAALSEATDPSKQLSTQMRQATAGRAGATMDQAMFEKSETLKSMGGLGDKVHSLVQNKLRDQLSTDQPISISSDAVTLVEDDTRSPEEQAALEAYMSSDKGVADLNALAKAMGLDSGKSEEELEAALNKHFTTDVAAQVSAQIGSFEVAEVLDELGYDQAALDELGITGNIETFDDLEAELTRIEQEEFSKTQDLASNAFDPDLSEAERGEARQALRDTGATGERDIEQQVSDIVDSLENATQVEFGGEVYEVEDLLSNSGMTELIREFINNPETATALRESEPELSKFIDANMEALDGALANIIPDETVADTVAIQAENAETEAAITTAFTGIPADVQKQILKKVFDNYGEGWQDQPYAMEEVGDFIDIIKDPAYAEFTQNFVGAMDGLSMYSDEIMKMSKKQLKKLGFLDSPPTNMREKIKRYHLDQREIKKRNKAAESAETATTFILQNLKGPDGKPMDRDTALARERALFMATGVKSDLLNALENPQEYLRMDKLDINDWADAGGPAVKEFTGFSKKDKVGPYSVSSLRSTTGKPVNLSYYEQNFIHRAMADGKLSSSELSGASGNTLQLLLDGGGPYLPNGKPDKKLRKKMKTSIKLKQIDSADKLYDEAAAFITAGNPEAAVAFIRDKLRENFDRSPGNRWDVATLSKNLERWEGYVANRKKKKQPKKSRGSADHATPIGEDLSKGNVAGAASTIVEGIFG